MYTLWRNQWYNWTYKTDVVKQNVIHTYIWYDYTSHEGERHGGGGVKTGGET